MTGIRQKVFLLLGSLTLLLCVVFIAITFFAAYIVEDEIMGRLLAAEAEYIRAQYEDTGELPQPRQHFMQLYDDVAALPKEVKTVLNKTPRAREIFTSSETHYHLAYVRITEDYSPILLAEVTSLLVVTNLSNKLAILFAAVIALALLIAAFFTYRISRHTVLPILHLTEELKRQAQQETVELPKYSDEIGYLSRMLEDNLNRLQQALSREKHFTRDVSHELRTPVTVIKNTLAIAEKKPLTEEETSRISKANNDIENTIDVLFMLARAESLALAKCNITAIVEDVILALHTEIEAKFVEVEVKLAENVEATTNKALFRLMVSNLILNALHHSNDERISIELENGYICVANTIDKDCQRRDEQQLLQAGKKSLSSQGIGQGLFLISRIVEAMDWKMSIDQNDTSFDVRIELIENS